MKRLLLASTVLAVGGQLFVSPALAAPPRPAVPGFSWTGCYIGAHVGAGWNRNSISQPFNPAIQTITPVGSSVDVNSGADFLGGAQIGCDYQFATSWVVGIQGDASWGNLSGQANDPFFAGKFGNPLTLHSKTDWTASATARIGYAWDRVLVYGTVGPAWAHNKYSIQNVGTFGNPSFQFCVVSFPVPCNPDGSDTRVGWTLGFGFEWAFANNWSAGLAYNHFDFGTRSVTLSDPRGNSGGAVSEAFDVKQRIDTVKLSINYRFGWPGH